MSKAFDRVNIYMLEKALLRLKTPSAFVTLIKNLFTDRMNRIITAHGLTDEYEVLTGIDQGEVISPILWCIYYDPLLCKIQSQDELGYRMEHRRYSTNHTVAPEILQQTITDLAFMDDTTWISFTKRNLEHILNIANSFYDLNNISVNNDKAVIITNQTNSITIDLELGHSTQLSLFNNNTQLSQIYRIKTILPSQSTRVLGVWFNSQCNKSFVINQVRSEIRTDTRIMKHKILTDKQLLYIYNTVIIPKLEYRTQLSCLTKNDCFNLQFPYRTLFKHKLKLSKTCPNSILFNRLLYNFRDLYDVTLQSKIS